MELQQLYIFQEVAHQENMRKAADALFLSQSAVSKAISALERDIGFSLFLRNRSGLELTAGGQIFFQHVKKALIELDVGKNKGLESMSSAQGTLNIGSTMQWFVYKPLYEFQEKYPGITINCNNGTLPVLLGQLTNKEIFLAVTYESHNDERIVSVPIISEDCFIISGKNIGHNRNVSLRDLGNERFSVSSLRSAWAEQEKRFFEQAGINPEIVFRGLSPRNIATWITKSQSMCIVPGHLAFNLAWSGQNTGLYCYHLTDSFTQLEMFFTTFREYSPSPYETEFSALIQDALEEVESQINDFIFEKF